MRLERGSLIVSCKVPADNPLHGPQFMRATALASRDGGAKAIRANGPEAGRIDTPVIAAGRFNTPERAGAAIEAGAYALVVGTMITNPQEIARRFARAVAG